MHEPHYDDEVGRTALGSYDEDAIVINDIPNEIKQAPTTFVRLSSCICWRCNAQFLIGTCAAGVIVGLSTLYCIGVLLTRLIVISSTQMSVIVSLIGCSGLLLKICSLDITHRTTSP